MDKWERSLHDRTLTKSHDRTAFVARSVCLKKEKGKGGYILLCDREICNTNLTPKHPAVAKYICFQSIHH